MSGHTHLSPGTILLLAAVIGLLVTPAIVFMMWILHFDKKRDQQDSTLVPVQRMPAPYNGEMILPRAKAEQIRALADEVLPENRHLQARTFHLNIGDYPHRTLQDEELRAILKKAMERGDATRRQP